jgi:pyrroloquinoline quinone biosynthesis protein B
MPLEAIILGAGAGGGLPQWNCGCANCRAARAGRIPAMTQSSIAVTGNGRDWAVVNASPDIRGQLAAVPRLHPTAPREVPLRAVLLTNGDIDHVAGLLTLRERQRFTLFATEEILGVLAANPIFAALDRELVARRPVPLDAPFALAPDLEARLFAVPGKVPLYLEGETVVTDVEGEQTVGVELRANGDRALYIPGCARLSPALAGRLRGAPLVLFDGTLWSDDEMIRLGLGTKTGRRMGHMPMSGPDGSLAALASLGIARKLYVHLNNSNPAVDPASPEAAEVRAAGWEIARDRMEIAL